MPLGRRPSPFLLKSTQTRRNVALKWNYFEQIYLPDRVILGLRLRWNSKFETRKTTIPRSDWISLDELAKKPASAVAAVTLTRWNYLIQYKFYLSDRDSFTEHSCIRYIRSFRHDRMNKSDRDWKFDKDWAPIFTSVTSVASSQIHSVFSFVDKQTEWKHLKLLVQDNR